MSGATALLGLRLRQAFRAGVGSGRPTFMRSVRRPLIMGVIVVFVATQLYVAASAWVAENLGAAHGIIVALLLPALAALGSATVFVIFFYAFNGLITSFADGRAIRALLLTPLSPKLIMAERLAFASLGFSALLLAATPALFAVGSIGLPREYDVAVVIVILFLPVLPTCLAALVLLPLLRWLPPTVARTVSTLAGTLLGLAFFIGTRVLAVGGRGSLPMPPDWLPSTWPGQFIAAAGLRDTASMVRYGVLMIGLAVGAFLITVDASARVFTTGAGSYNAVRKHGRRRRVWATSRGGLDSRRPSWWPVFTKDWLTLRRDPQRLIVLLYPLAIIGFNAYQVLGQTALRRGGASAGATVVLIMVTAVLFVNTTAPAFVNGEGRMLVLLALTPVSAGAIFGSKWFSSALPPLVLSEIVLVVLGRYLDIDGGTGVLLGAILGLLIVALAGITLLVTVLWPKPGASSARRPAGAFASLVSLLVDAAVCAGSGAGIFAYLFFWHGQEAALALGAVAVGLLALIALVAFLGPSLFTRLMHSQKVFRPDP